jgi:hypothetical protein
MFILAAAAMTALNGSPPVIDATARGIDRSMLMAALTAPESGADPRGKRRYCFEDRPTDPTTPRRICRTLADWRRLGLEPTVG